MNAILYMEEAIMNNNFDKTKFSILVKRAIGSGKQKDFAQKIQLSPEHLSRIINSKYDKPPSIETIKKIAKNALNDVTYFELLESAGYASKQDIPDNFSLPEQPVIEKFMSGTILTALQNIHVPWTLETDNKEGIYNLSISLNQGFFKRWYFFYLNSANQELRKNQFNSYYLRLIFECLEPTDKISFVTSLDEEYKLYMERTPNNLNLNLSIILIDEPNLSIKTEYWLRTNSILDDKSKSFYTL